MRELLVLLAIVAGLHLTCGQVVPATVTDNFKNVADDQSQITWADIPKGTPYETDPDAYSTQGFAPLYQAMHGFVAICFGKEMPWDEILGLVGGTTSFDQALIMDLLKFGYGYGACLVIGILFIIIFPIVGMCMCCCRCCCGNCGGKMMQKRSGSWRAWRTCYFVTLFISCTFLGCGIICSYVANERMRTLFDDITNTVDTNLLDLKVYANNTVDEVNYMALDGFKFASEVMNRDLDNIGPLVGGAVQDDFNNQAGVDAAFDQLLAMDPLLLNLIDDLKSVDTAKTSVTTSVTDLDTVLSNLGTAIDTTFTNCGTDCGTPPSTSDFNSNFDPNAVLSAWSNNNLIGYSFNPEAHRKNLIQMPSFATQLADLEAVHAQNLTALVLKGKQEFENINGIVEAEAATVVTQIRTMITSFETTIDTSLDSVTEILTLFDSMSDFTSILDLNNITLGGDLTLSTIEMYRYYAGLGLSIFPALILCLQLIGLIMGCIACCCTEKDAIPTERGCMSNCGGCLLMASVGLIFIFGALLMLLVFITYAIGAPMERVLCKEIRDPEFTIWKTILDGGDPANGPYTTLTGDQSGYTMGQLLFQDPSVPVTLSQLLADCRDNKGAYPSLHLENMINLTELTNYEDTIDLETEINNNLNVDLSNLVLLDINTRNQLTEMSTAMSAIDFPQLVATLEVDTSLVDFSSVHGTLITAADAAAAVGRATEETELRAHADELLRIQGDEYAAVNTAQADMLVKVTTLNGTASTVPSTVTTLTTNLETTQNTLQNNGQQIVKNQSLIFGNRVLGIADQFAAEVTSNVENKLGKCKPIHNFYVTVLEQLICGTFFDNWNSIWFTLGWCLTFMVVGLVLSVKLAKHIRKMDTIHPEDGESIYMNKEADYAPPTSAKGNKIHPI